MFEQLFSRASAIARHRSAPMAEGREAFLKHLAQQSYSRSSLRAKAYQLLAIVQQTRLATAGSVDPELIERAAQMRHYIARSDQRARPSGYSRSGFRYTATTWLRFLWTLSASIRTKSEDEARIALFEHFLCDERGLSPHTIRGCRSNASHLLTHLRGHGRTLSMVTVDDLDALMNGFTTSGWKRSSLSPVANGVRSFLRFAERQRWCSPGLSEAVSAPRTYVDERLPKGLDWEAVTRLLSSTDGDSARDIRDYAIILLLAFYGLRCAEVAAIRLEDINWDNATVRIRRPKQRHSQLYPLHAVIGNAIARYLRDARPPSKSRYVFLHLLAPFGNLGHPSIYYAVSNRLKAMGIRGQRCGPHALRHSCAQHLLDSGFSFKHVGDYLGHRSSAATRIYAKVNLRALRKVAQIDMRGIL